MTKYLNTGNNVLILSNPFGRNGLGKQKDKRPKSQVECADLFILRDTFAQEWLEGMNR